jgi:phospholipid/cholesterol/gamma-HCH transport system substrate-binding protein
MADARPLAERLEKTLASTHQPTAVLAPYAPEMSQFFRYWVSANRPQDKSGHYLRISLLLRPETVDGVLGVRDPLVHRNPYPAPGQAQRDRATSILGSN